MIPVAMPTSSGHQTTQASVYVCGSVLVCVATVGRSDAALCRPLVA